MAARLLSVRPWSSSFFPATSAPSAKLVVFVSATTQTFTYKDSDAQNFMIPAATQNNAWQLYLLSVMYLVIAVVALVGFVMSVRRKGTYFRASFLGVSCSFCLLRGLLTLIYYPNWGDHMFWVYMLGEFVPVYLQYWTFSLLLLFIAKCLYVIHDQEARIHKWTFYPLYHLVQALLFFSCVVVSIVLSRNFDPADTSEWDRYPTIYVSALYGLLSVGGFVYSVRSYRMISLASPSVERQRQLAKFFVLIPLYIAIFFSRFMWNLLYYAKINPLQNEISHWIDTEQRSSFYTAFLIYYGIVELLPTAMVVFAFTGGLCAKPQTHSHDGSDIHIADSSSSIPSFVFAFDSAFAASFLQPAASASSSAFSAVSPVLNHNDSAQQPLLSNGGSLVAPYGSITVPAFHYSSSSSLSMLLPPTVASTPGRPYVAAYRHSPGYRITHNGEQPDMDAEEVEADETMEDDQEAVSVVAAENVTTNGGQAREGQPIPFAFVAGRQYVGLSGSHSVEDEDEDEDDEAQRAVKRDVRRMEREREKERDRDLENQRMKSFSGDENNFV